MALLGVLALMAVGPRLVLQLQAPIFLVLDSSSYARPAYDLLDGAGLTTGLKRPIGYPLLLAGVLAAFGPDLTAVSAVQHALGVVTVGLTYLLGRACFSRWVGFGAAAAIAVSSPQLSLEHTVLSEALFTMLLIALTLVLIRATRASGHGPAIVAGVLLGLAALVKPVGQAMLPLALAFAALRPGTLRRRVLSAALLTATFAAIVLPWMGRNLAVHGRFTVGGGLGESLLASTVDFSRGTFRFDGPDLPPEPDPTRRAARRIIQAGVTDRASEGAVFRRLRSELGLSEAEADRLARDLVFETIRRQPLDFIGTLPGFARRLFELGHRSPALNWGAYKLWDDEDRVLAQLVRRPTPSQEAGRTRIGALLEWYRPSRLGVALPLLALAGLAAAWRLRPLAPAVVPGLLAACLVLVQVTLDGPVARYRYPIDPLLHVLALGAVGTGLGYARRRAARGHSDVGHSSLDAFTVRFRRRGAGGTGR